MMGVGPAPAEGQEDKDLINAGGFITACLVHVILTHASAWHLARWTLWI